MHGDELHRELLQREVGEFLQLTLHDDGAGLALERLDAEQDRDRAGAGLLAEYRLRQALLARSLDQHGGVVLHAAIKE
jgi:hypothetical protein